MKRFCILLLLVLLSGTLLADRATGHIISGSITINTLSPPENLTAEAGDGYVDLYWDAPATRSLLGYNLYRDYYQVNTEIIIYPNYFDDDVINGIPYEYYVRAIYMIETSEVESWGSNTVQATPHETEPPLPANAIYPFDEAYDVDVSLTFEWEPNMQGPIPDGYLFNYWINQGEIDINLLNDLGNTTVFTVTEDLLSATQYIWRVVPYVYGDDDVLIKAEDSPVWSFETSYATAPDQVTLVLDISGSGLVEIDGVEVTEYPSQTNHDFGSLITLTALADLHWEFEKWNINDVDILEATTEVQMTETISALAIFKKLPPHPAIALNPPIEALDVETDLLFEWQADTAGPPPDGYLFNYWLAIEEQPEMLNLGNVTSYQVTEALLYATEYEWQVIPYVIVSGRRESLSPLQGRVTSEQQREATIPTLSHQESRTTIEDEYIYAEDSPVWIFETEAEQFTLTVDRAGQGVVEIDGTEVTEYPAVIEYTEGTEVTLTAIAELHWEFEKWVINGVDVFEVETVIEMNEDKTVTAHFAQLPPLPATAIHPLNEADNVEVSLTFEWEPNSEGPAPDGYLFNHRTAEGGGNGLIIYTDLGDVTTYTVGNDLAYNTEYVWRVIPYVLTDEEVQIEAEDTSLWSFTTEEERFTLTVDRAGQGVVETDGTEVTEYPAVFEYTDGTEVTLTAIAELHWEFEKWTINGVDVFEVETVLEMNENKTVTAYFEQLPPHPAIAINPPIEALDVDTDLLFEWQADTAGPPPDGYIFNYWIEGGVDREMIDVGEDTFYYAEGLQYITIYNWQVIPYIIDGDDSYIFAEDCPFWVFETKAEQFTLMVDRVGQGVVETDGTELTEYPAVLDYTDGTEVMLTAIADLHWEFEKWVINGVDFFGAETVIEMNENKTVTAYFEQLPPHPAIAINPPEEASDVDTALLFEWQASTTGPPPEGYFFNYWIAGEAQPEMIDIGDDTTFSAAGLNYSTIYNWQVIPYINDGDVQLLAEDCPVWSFETEAEVFTLTVDRVGQGVIVIDETEISEYPSVIEYVDGTEVMLTAIADLHWEFDKWTINGVDFFGAETVIEMNENKTVTAYFGQLPPHPAIAINPPEEASDVDTALLFEWQASTTGPPPDGYLFNYWIAGEAQPEMNDFGEDTSYYAEGLNYSTIYNWQVIPYINDGDTQLLAEDCPVWSFMTEAEVFTLMVDRVGQGVIEIDETEITEYPAVLDYTDGTEVVLTAIADLHWEFEKWVINGVDFFGAETVIEMNENKTVTAYFGQLPPHPAIALYPPDEESNVPIDFEFSWQANNEGPNPDGYFFSYWIEGEEGLIQPIDVGEATSYWSEDIGYNTIYSWQVIPYIIAGDDSYLFAEDCPVWSFMTEAEVFTLTVDRVGQGVIEIDETEVTEYPAVLDYTDGTELILTAIADLHWEFEKWVINDVDFFEVETVIEMNEDKTVIAHFGQLPSLPATALYPPDEESSVPIDFEFSWQANSEGPNPDGYFFSYWIEGEEGLIQPIDVGEATSYWSEDIGYNTTYSWQVIPYIIAGDDSYLFAEDCPVWSFMTEAEVFTLTVDRVGEGVIVIYETEVTDYPSVIEYDDGTEVVLAAFAEQHWEFEKWTINGVDVFEAITVVEMTEDKNALALFSKLPPHPAIAINPPEEASDVETALLFEWQASTTGPPPEGYFFNYWIAGEAQPEMIDVGDDTTFSAAGLNYSTIYNWQVIPYIYDGDVQLLAEDCPLWSFETAEAVLNPPQNLTAEAGDNSVWLEWEAPETRVELLGYNVFRDGLMINPDLVFFSEYEDNTAINGETYEYYVTAFYAEGESEPSNSVVVFLPIPNVPPLVSNVQALQRGDGSMLVDIYYDVYDEDGDEMTLFLEVSDDGGETWDVSATILLAGSDIGPGILSGENKHIVWDIGEEHPGLYSEAFRFKIIADDGHDQTEGFDWCLVPAGDYTYGENSDILNIGYDYEIMKYVVTNAQFLEFLQEAYAAELIWISGDEVQGYYPGDEHWEAGIYRLYEMGTTFNDNSSRISFSDGQFFLNYPSAFSEDDYLNHPVVYVSWFGAWHFADYYGWRLPTENEWEKAARGMTGYDYPWGNTIDGSRANYWESGDPWDNGTTPVGFYNGQVYQGFQTTDSPSPFGVHDMAGNVWNWTDSWWSSSGWGQDRRVLRGGSWINATDFLRSWNRSTYEPTFVNYGSGFRCVRTLRSSSSRAIGYDTSVLVIINTLGIPVELTAEAGYGVVHLDWEAPLTRREREITLLGYNVYRDGAIEPINDEIIIVTEYSDYDVINEQTYEYYVKSVYQIDTQEIESWASNAIEATPEEADPPYPAIALYPEEEGFDIPASVLFEWAPDLLGPAPDGYLFNYWLAIEEQPEMMDLGNETSYQVTENLLYNTEYHWQVIPYIDVSSGREMLSPLHSTVNMEYQRRTSLESRLNLGQTSSLRDDYIYAENSPIWSFTTEAEVFTLTVGRVGQGVIEIDETEVTEYPSVLDYTDGTEVILTAITDSHWEFEKWVINGADVFGAETVIEMNENKMVTAYFGQLPPHPAIALYPPEEASDVDTDLLFEWQTDMTGPPPDGYFFNYWIAGEAQPEMIDVGEDTSYYAEGLNYSTIYNWQVIPYINDGDAQLLAEDCPVWSFMTEAEPPPSITIGTGTMTNTATQAAPINIYFRSIRTQSVYTAAELYEAGMSGTSITHLAYYVEQAPLYSLPNFQIRMRHTTAEDASQHIDGPFEQVYQNDHYMPTEGGWDVLEFSLPFVWNGIDNILIDTTFDQVPTWNTSGQQRIFYSPNGMRFVRSDTAPQGDNPTTMVAQYKPQVQLYYQPSDVYNDLAATTISGPSTATVGIQSIYTVNVRNIGYETQESYTVKLMKTGDIEIASYESDIPLAHYQQESFNLVWIPSEEGEYEIWGKVVLAGDENPDNDTTSAIPVTVYPEGTAVVNVGTDTTTDNTLPLNFHWRNSVSQTIYYDAEVYVSGLITHITYYYNFTQHLGNQPVRIWMGLTDQESLTDGWINAAQQTLVFDGSADFFIGDNELELELQVPFSYSSGNLVITAQRPMDTTFYLSTNHFYYSITDHYPNRSRNIHSDSNHFDPFNLTDGTLTNRVPNTTIQFTTSGMGSLQGYVYSHYTDNPLESVLLQLDGLPWTQLTDDEGEFFFGFVPVGEQTLIASKEGFYDATADILILENETTEVELSMIPVPYPPQNLTANAGNNLVMLQWEEPQNRRTGDFTSNRPSGELRQRNQRLELLGYNVFRDGVEINPELVLETEYEDTDVINGVTYQYYVTAVYDVGESQPSNIVWATPHVPVLLSPVNLTADQIDHDSILLEWEEPFYDGWIHWDNGINSSSIGSGSSMVFKVAARFAPEHLSSFGVAGKHLSKVRFFPNEANASYSINVWTGGTATHPGTLVVDQPVISPVIQDWNTVQLDYPIFISGTEELWIGYHIDTTTGHPAGCDHGPALDGLGNMIYFNNEWSTLLDIASGLNYNWNIQGFAAATREGEATVFGNQRPEGIIDRVENPRYQIRYNPDSLTISGQVQTDNSGRLNRQLLLGYNVYRNGVMINSETVEETNYLDSGLAAGTYEYYVTALYDEGESEPSNTVVVSVLFETPHPAIAVYPEDGEIDVPVDLTFEWIPEPNTPLPDGYLFNYWLSVEEQPELMDLGDFTSYQVAEILLYETEYQWQVVPYIVENGRRELLSPLQMQGSIVQQGKGETSESRNTVRRSTRENDYLYAEDCPVWSFTTEVLVFAGGSGTEGDPWQIATAEHLNNVRNYLDAAHNDKHFIQIADIDLYHETREGGAYWNDGEGWEPIGSSSASEVLIPFQGSYNGDGHTIHGLYINRPDSHGQGLFGGTRQAYISNLGLTNVDVTGNVMVGGLVGTNSQESVISNCFTTGFVDGQGAVGGLVGANWQGNPVVKNCASSATVSNSLTDGQSHNVGGLVGNNGYSSNIYNSHSSGNVIGYASNTGGLVGYNRNSSVIENSYSTSSVTGLQNIGGLVGRNDNSAIENCYSVGHVSGNSELGGLVGFSSRSADRSEEDPMEVTGCMTIDYDIYGDSIDRTRSVFNSYWNTQTSGQITSAGGEGRTTIEMTYPYAVNTYLDWDFAEVWAADQAYNLNNGYPYLRSAIPFVTEFAGGLGTESNPWQIATAEHLYNIRNYLGYAQSDKYFIQIADIDLYHETREGGAYWNDGEGWEPIGYSSVMSFRGNYNGNDYSVSGLYINRGNQDYQGLFGYNYGATIENLGVTNVDVTGQMYVGALVGHNNVSSTINNCYSSGTLNGSWRVGGLVGYNFDNSAIINSSSICSVNGDNRIGGLVGACNTYALIINSFSTGMVTGTDNVGGLAGWICTNTSLYNSYSTSDVSGNSIVGGLVGSSTNSSSINNCYSIGSVIGNYNIGGLLGGSTRAADDLSENDIGISENMNLSYNTNRQNHHIPLAFEANELDGRSRSVFNSYWNTESSGLTFSVGGEGRTTAEMTYPYAANTYVDWDFAEVWAADEAYDVNNGYPYLYATPVPEPALNPPYNLVAVPGDEVVHLSWESPEPRSLLGFNIYRDFHHINLELIEETSYSDTDVENGITYIYFVTAVYDIGESGPSNVVQVIPNVPQPIISVTPDSVQHSMTVNAYYYTELEISNLGNEDLAVNLSLDERFLANDFIFSIGSTSSLTNAQEQGRDGNVSFNSYHDRPDPDRIADFLQEHNGDIVTFNSYRSGYENGSREIRQRSSNVLLFRNSLAWGLNVMLPLLQNYGANVTIASSDHMGTINLDQFDLIILESCQQNSFYQAYVSNLGRFTSYVNGGGFLQIHTATWHSRIPSLPLPGSGSTLQNTAFDHYNNIADPLHPAVQGLPDPMYGNYANHEAFTGFPAGTNVITTTTSGLPTTIEYNLGLGTVLATGMCWEHAYNYNHSSGQMLPLILQYTLNYVLDTSWLTVSPAELFLEPGETGYLALTFNTYWIDVGHYETGILINSNDPDQPLITVPVSLDVYYYYPPAQNVVAQEIENEIEISWEPPDDRRNNGLTRDNLIGYKVWRFVQGFEEHEDTWTLLTNEVITNTSFTDTDWVSIDDGIYRWGVKAVYESGISEASLSNPLEKTFIIHWTIDNSPYTFTEDVVIEELHILIIDDGVEIIFSPEVSLIIHGSATANGALFRAADPASGWNGILLATDYENSLFDNCDIIDARHPLVFDNSSALFTNTLISKNEALFFDDEIAVQLIDDANPVFDNLEIENYETGVLIINTETRSITTPTITNIRIRNTTSPVRELSTAIAVEGAVALDLDTAEIENYSTGIKFNGLGTAYDDDIPSLRNITISDTLTVRTNTTGIELTDVNQVVLEDTFIEGYTFGLDIRTSDDNNRTSSTATVSNIFIRNTTDDTRENSTGIVINGGVALLLEEAEIENYVTGIEYYSDGTVFDRSTPTMTNIRIRNTTSPVRTDDQGIVLRDVHQIIVTDAEVDDYTVAVYLETTENLLRSISTPTLTNIRLRNTTSPVRTTTKGIEISGAVSLILEDAEIDDFDIGIEYLSDGTTFDRSTPTLTNIRIRNTTSPVRTDTAGILLRDVYQIEIDDGEIDDYPIGMIIETSDDLMRSISTPTLTNIRIRNTTSPVRTDTKGIEVNGAVALIIDGAEIDDYDIGIEYIGDGTMFDRSTPTMTNMRIRNTTSPVRNASYGLFLQDVSYVIAESDSIIGYSTGIHISTTEENTRSTSTPTLTNIRIRNTTSPVREESKGIEISGAVALILDDAEIDDYDIGIEYLSDGTVFDRSTPTMTNIRLRNTTSPVRTNTTGIILRDLYQVEITEGEMDDYHIGMLIETTNDDLRSISTPTLTNIRIRNTTSPVREESRGIEINGTVALILEDAEIDDYDIGINYQGDGTTFDRSTPTMTNIRIRNTTSPVRTNNIGLVLRDLNLVEITDGEVDDYPVGLLIETTLDDLRSTSTPTLTNMRIRNTTSPVRTETKGIAINGSVALIIDDAEIDDYDIGINYIADGTMFDRSTPTMTNVRIRNTTSPVRNVSYGMVLQDLSYVVAENDSIIGYPTGIHISTTDEFGRSISSPTMTNIRIRNTTSPVRTGTKGIEINGQVTLELDDAEIDDYDIGIKYISDGTIFERSTPTLTNIRIRNTTSPVRTDAIGMILRDLYRIELSEGDIEDYPVGLLIETTNENTRSTSTPTLTNMRIRNTTSPVRTESKGIQISGAVSLQIDDAEIDDFSIGINYLSDGTLFDRSTPTMTNVRIRNTTSPVRNASYGIYMQNLRYVVAESDSIIGYPTGIHISTTEDGPRSVSSPTLTNIRIRNTTSPVRTGTKGIEIEGAVSLELDDAEIDDYDIGIEYIGDGTIFDRSTPTMTNIRIRNTTSPVRTEAIGLVLSDLNEIAVTEAEIDDYLTGIMISTTDNFIRSTSTPTMTNIRLRNTTSPVRNQSKGIMINGSVALILDDAEIDDYETGIEYLSDGTLFERSTPTMTNIRLRNTTSPVRTNTTGISLTNLSQIELSDSEIEDYATGLSVLTSNERVRTTSTPTITNIRIRNTTSPVRTEEFGIYIDGDVSALLESLLIEDYYYGIKYIGRGATGINRSTPTMTNIRIRNTTSPVRNNPVGIYLQDVTDVLFERNAVYVVGDPAVRSAVPGNALILEGISGMNLHNNTIWGYETGLNASESSGINFDSNVIWAEGEGLANPIVTDFDFPVNNSVISLLEGVFPGDENENVDPLFVKPRTGDFYLKFRSPIKYRDIGLHDFDFDHLAENHTSPLLHTGWNLMGVPHITHPLGIAPTPVAVFADYLNPFYVSPYYTSIVQLNTIPDTQVNVEGLYHLNHTGSYNVPPRILPMMGYWVNNSGYPTSIELYGFIDDGSYELTVPGQPGNNLGWYLLANPYDVPINWNNGISWSHDSGADFAYVFRYLPEYNAYSYILIDDSEDNVIEPWEGFFVKSSDPGHQILFQYPDIDGGYIPSSPPSQRRRSVTQSTDRSRNDIAAEEWLIFLSAQHQDSADIIVVSAHENASSGYDIHDVPKLPQTPFTMTTPLSFAIDNTDWTEFAGYYTRDTKPLNNQTWSWDLLLDASNVFAHEITDYTIRVSLSDMMSVPAGYQFSLVNLLNGEMIDPTVQDLLIDIHELIAPETTGKLRGAQRNSSNDLMQIPLRFHVTNISMGTEDILVDDEIPVLHLANYPNPFNPDTRISFAITHDAPVKLEIFNVKGQLVDTLIEEQLSRGSHSVLWNGTDKRSNRVASGVYFYRLTVGEEVITRKMIMMK